MRTIIEKTDIQKIAFYFETMDIENIAGLLSNEIIYVGVPKHEFIDQLEVTFAKFKSLGDHRLISYKGVCDFCNKGTEGYRFIGMNSRNYINIIFEIKDNIITDLLQCSRIITEGVKIRGLNKHLTIIKEEEVETFEIEGL